MSTVDFLFDYSALEKLEQALEACPELFAAEFVQGMAEAVDILEEPLAKYPAPPLRPIHWDSPRQKRAFFASNGFEHGIPHQRGGRLPNSWRGEVTTPSADVIRGNVWSEYERAKYVQDQNQQSNIHMGNWITVQDTLVGNHARVQEVFLEKARVALSRLKDMLT